MSRYQLNGILVVHEGLKNNPQIIESLKDNITKINSIIDNDNSHLADIGIFIQSISENLHNISQECFKQHKIEKNIE